MKHYGRIEWMGTAYSTTEESYRKRIMANYSKTLSDQLTLVHLAGISPEMTLEWSIL